MYVSPLNIWTWTDGVTTPFVATQSSMMMVSAGYIRRQRQMGHRFEILPTIRKILNYATKTKLCFGIQELSGQT